jgi:hypothetical protein
MGHPARAHSGVDAAMKAPRAVRRVLVALAVLPAALHSQEITGVVRTSAGIPVPGAVLSLLDSSGATLLRALTATGGTYRLVRTPNARQLRVVRMGFRPRSVPLPAGGTLDIVLEPLPTMLAAVQVIDQPNCPRRSDRATALSLWEQARAGLLSTVVARDGSRASVDRFVFYRIVGETRPGVLTQVVSRDSVVASRPFGASRSAREFVARGFHDENTDTFYAPDADVMLDDSFTHGYCFRLADRDRARPGQVGLRFDPAARRRGRVDIQGTLWIDTTARELRDIEFRYLGLPVDADVLRLGGYVVFEMMPPGFPAVTRWAMRVGAPRAFPLPGDERRLLPARGLEVHELGGELARAAWGGATWTATLGSVSGRLTHLGAPVAGAQIRLIGTPYRAITSATGAFELRDLLPGRYVVSVPDSGLNAIGLELTNGAMISAAREPLTGVELELPTVTDFLNFRCPKHRNDSLRVLAGRVYLPNGEFASKATVHLRRANTWRSVGASDGPLVVPLDLPVSTVDTTRLVWESYLRERVAPRTMFYVAHDGALGAGGTFFVCGLPAQALIRAEATEGSLRGSTSFVTRVLEPRIYTVRIDLAP